MWYGNQSGRQRQQSPIPWGVIIIGIVMVSIFIPILFRFWWAIFIVIPIVYGVIGNMRAHHSPVHTPSPTYQPPVYQRPSSEPFYQPREAEPYRGYEQGYRAVTPDRPVPQEPIRPYQRENPKSGTQDYDLPQAEYPQQMPPQ